MRQHRRKGAQLFRGHLVFPDTEVDDCVRKRVDRRMEVEQARQLLDCRYQQRGGLFDEALHVAELFRREPAVGDADDRAPVD